MDSFQALPVRLEVNGQRSIMLLDPAPLAMSKPSKLRFYHGTVRSGTVHNRLVECTATIFRFDGQDDASELYAKLTQVDHSCVVKALGVANGVGKYIDHSFVALTPFDTTLEIYTKKEGPGADENGRLTEDFITLINDSIDGLEELHKFGYCCPNLQGDDIAVIRQSGLISAKIWNFKRCSPGEEEKQKDGDWFRLGRLIFSASCSEEVMDLLRKIKSGILKGKSIMKHSALLTVRKKFENVLAFNLHISIYCQRNPNQSQKKDDLKVTELCAANLVGDLDRSLPWVTLGWTQAGHGRDLLISTKTLRGFVNQLRILVEHEIFYIPEEMSSLTPNEVSDGTIKSDLEHQLQGKSCGELFRAVQSLVAELNLEY